MSKLPLALLLSCVSAYANNGFNSPFEVMSSGGPTSRSAPFYVPNPLPSGQLRLWLSIHGLEYQNEMAFQINNGVIAYATTASVTCLGLAASYGCIGGGYSTLTLTIDIPASQVVQGTNSIRFKFLGTDGESSGFRILDMDIWDSAGHPLIDRTQVFIQDPAWDHPIYTDATNIATGKTLYQTAQLSQPLPNRGMNAHCGDCHTRDGRDLRYFNYSTYSITMRAQFHGLTSTEGDQISSYIKSLKTPAPGRPWNPPYQPGPGLDAKGVANWSAGAGIGAVLAADLQMQPYFAPTGTVADFAASNDHNIREIPIAFQLPDWNRWLPRIHPIDAYGTAFTSSAAYTDYLAIRAALAPGDAAKYGNARYAIADWVGDRTAFVGPLTPVNGNVAWTNPATAKSVYGVGLWQNVKMWEINQEFALEGMCSVVYGALADSRCWYANAVFQSSPSIMKIPAPSNVGISNGSSAGFTYFSFMWYILQLTLNNGQKQQACTNPVDWGYFHGFVGGQAKAAPAQGLLQMLLSAKALNVSNNGKSPAVGCVGGWSPEVNTVARWAVPENAHFFDQVSTATRNQLIGSFMQAWLNEASKWTPAQFYAGNFAAPDDVVTPGFGDGNFASRMAFTIPRLKYWNGSTALVSNLVVFCSGIWPNYNWSIPANATCTTATDGSAVIRCSNDQ